MTKQRRTFTPEFKREAACLVLDHAEWWAERYQKSRTQTLWSKRWKWHTSSVESLKGWCSIPTRDRYMAAVSFAKGYGAIACARA